MLFSQAPKSDESFIISTRWCTGASPRPVQFPIPPIMPRKKDKEDYCEHCDSIHLPGKCDPSVSELRAKVTALVLLDDNNASPLSRPLHDPSEDTTSLLTQSAEAQEMFALLSKLDSERLNRVAVISAILEKWSMGRGFTMTTMHDFLQSKRILKEHRIWLVFWVVTLGYIISPLVVRQVGMALQKRFLNLTPNAVSIS